MAEITFEQLEENNACDNKLAFKELFGDKAKVSPEVARKYASEFDWEWAANNLLSKQLHAQYNKLMESYRRRHRADVEIALYRLNYTRTGRRRINPTNKQKQAYAKACDDLNREFRVHQAETFALLYIGQRSIKPPKTEILMDKLSVKLAAAIREILEMNRMEKFKEDYDIIESVRNLLNTHHYRVQDISREVSRAFREKERQTRRTQVRETSSDHEYLTGRRYNESITVAYDPF